jgi:helix-turn-helix protein
VSAENRIKVLPIDELAEVLGSDKRADLFIGGEVISGRSEILFYRGNLEPITVPLGWFTPRPGSPDPDAAQFAVTGYGQTVCLGDYEASTDAILYEFDEDYRTRAKKRALEQDSSLGGAIRRLRLQKGLRQTDFPGITAKEIARIEKGSLKRPHQETLQKISERTGVPVDQIHTY